VKRLRFRLLTLMIVVAVTALAAWRYELRRRSAEFASAMKRRSAEFASKADQHNRNIVELAFIVSGRTNFTGSIMLPLQHDPSDLTRTPQDSERQLRYLEDFYGYGLTENDLAKRRLTKRGQAQHMLRLLWIRYEVHMYFKYRHAATRPWLPVDPDPPVPPHGCTYPDGQLGPCAPPDDEWWRDGKLQMIIAEYLKTLPPLVPE
jgi:hypothetical protein